MRRSLTAGVTVLATVTLVAGCGSAPSGKPDREEVRPGLVTVLMANPAKPDRATAERIADCMLDKVYDSAHVKTLQAWAKGEQDKDEVSDNVVVMEASMECSKSVTRR
ncbi:hypothetical protein [Tsukamurella sp. PLM1]|uniref:hypothetical protein n=1 Tax=Tsukamurella sp. PLM1 TaxID=2929795 RepID=UPI002064C058|nr:hypothetical protein [Tsukamurella sp. PLM1]BDH58611.1 hypothetical protein MTP03_35500 [Tsukamurella sp. PLM1]